MVCFATRLKHSEGKSLRLTQPFTDSSHCPVCPRRPSVSKRGPPRTSTPRGVRASRCAITASPLSTLTSWSEGGKKKTKKYARKGAFREEHKARVIHNSVVAEHRFACAGSDRGLLMSCDSGAQNKPLFPSLREIGIMSV